MNVLFVDQFGKTSGRSTMVLSELMNHEDDVNMTALLAEAAELQYEKNYTTEIIRGFHGAYRGTFINKVINYLKALKVLDSLVVSGKYDILHLQWFSLPWIEWILLKRWKKKCKIVITIHDVVPFDNRPLEIQSLDKIYSNADWLLFHTEYAKGTFEKIYKTKKPFSIITQGYDEKTDYKILDKVEAKRHFNIPVDSVVVLCYGTIRYSKGLNLLMEAVLSCTHEGNKNIYLLAAGAPHNIDMRSYQKLADEIDKNHSGQVNFGFVPLEEEQWYFSAADILCLPYLELTQSGVAQLGLIYELPMIGTDVGAMNEVIKDNVNGLLIKPNSVDALKEALIVLSSDNEIRKKYSMASKKIGEEQFSLDNKAAEVIKVYRHLVNDSM